MAIKDRLYDVPIVGTALRVQDRYKDDAADQLAASIGFFGFLSLFPLVVLAVGLSGFLIDDPKRVVDAIREAIPGLSGLAGTEAEGLVATVARNAGAIAWTGAITLVLAGLRVVSAAMVATTRVFRRPSPEGVRGWLRRLGALALLGTLALGAATASSFAGIPIEGIPAVVRSITSFAVTFGLDLLLFLVAYRILAAGDGPTWRQLLPGAALAAIGWTALKLFGSTFVANQVATANEFYGTFAGIIALLLLLYLAGRLYLYGAELSALLCEVGPDGPPPPDDASHDASDDAADRTSDAEPGAPRGTVEEDAAPVADRADGPARTPAADEPSPAVSPATRARVDAFDRERAGQPAPVRHAIAFVLAIGAVAGLVAASRPWELEQG